LLAALTFLFIRGGIIGWQFGSPSNELMNNPFLKLVGDRYVPFSASEKLATVTFTLGKYLQLLFWPWPLTHDYYPRHIELMHWNDGRVLLSVLAYLALLLIALRGLARKTPLSFAIFYYLITLSIVSNLVFAVGTNMAERLLFMPSAGYSLALGLLLYRLAQTPKSHAAPVRSWYPALSVAVLLCVVYGALTIKRNPVWKNNYTLFSSDIVVSPNSAKLRNALGGETIAQAIQLDEREEARKTAMLSEAIEHLQEAARIHPHYKNAYLLLGNAHYFLRRYEEAIAYYQKALARDPNYREANNNLAIAYRDAGRYQGEQLGNLDRAIQYLEQAYQMQPGEYENVRLLGVAHGIKGNTRQAIEFFEKAAQLAPDNADAWYNLGSAYYNAGQPERGRQYQERAKEIDPEITRRMDQPQ
jgi:tetratricopeptide (TPR) repeat protein